MRGGAKSSCCGRGLAHGPGVIPHTQSAAPAGVRRVSLNESVEEMALRMRSLPGFVWLDTAGNAAPGEGLSLLAARPSREYRGHISDVSKTPQMP